MNQIQIAKQVKLNNGVMMPKIGLGTFELADTEKSYQWFKDALDIGYRHFDTALMYGNHAAMGQAFKRIFSEGKYQRKDIFITTKCFSSRDNAVEVLKQALKDLQTDYVDLYLIHFPMNFLSSEGVSIGLNHRPQHEVYAELEQCYELKLTKAIGVSNYNVQSLLNVLSFCKIKPSVNQVEISPYNQQPHLVEFCQKFRIQVVGYGNLARGGDNVNTVLGNKIDIFNEQALIKISKKHNTSVAQVCLNYIKNILNIVVIPKSQNKIRMQNNFLLDSFQLDQQDIQDIKALNIGIRTVDPYQIGLFGNIDFFA